MKMKRTVVKSKAFSSTPKPSAASKDFAKRPKSKAIKNAKGYKGGGYGGSSDPARND